MPNSVGPGPPAGLAGVDGKAVQGLGFLQVCRQSGINTSPSSPGVAVNLYHSSLQGAIKKCLRIFPAVTVLLGAPLLEAGTAGHGGSSC